MAARRLLILMLLLLVVSTLAATLVPPQAEREETTTETDRTARERGPGEDDERRAGNRVSRTVDASERAAERIELRLGDQLVLTVRSATADQVEVPALGQLEDVDPDAPARFDLLPPRPGSFEVRLLDARRTVARIRVRQR